jgi:hypothetical protein
MDFAYFVVPEAPQATAFCSKSIPATTTLQ